MTRYYKGPQSDHFNGTRFLNPGFPKKTTFKDFLRWQFSRKRPQWPSKVVVKEKDKPPRKVEGHTLRASFIGHATVLVQNQYLNLLTDPVYSERVGPWSLIGPKRVQEPGIDFEDLPPIDLVLISHNHYDHLDIQTLKRLVKEHNPLIVTPLGNDTLIHRWIPQARLQTLDWHQNFEIPGATVYLLPAIHWSSRTLGDTNHALWGAFAIRYADSSTIYFAGDTGYGEGRHFREACSLFEHFRLALLPIGAYKPEWFMSPVHISPQEAIQAFKDLNAHHGLAIHFETFHLADDTFGDPRRDLEKGIDNSFRALHVGEAWDVPE